VSYSGTTAIFAPASSLAPNTAYTAMITTAAKDLAGNPLLKNFVWSFTTGAAAVVTPPTVSLTDPLNAATGVPLNQKIAATFSKTMDASTIQTSTFRVMQGTTVISGFVSYSGVTATFSPASNLAPSTIYTATITTGVTDLAGNALANDFVWSFTTGTAVVIIPPTVSFTDPLNAETGVPLNQKIAATFSKTMDASTIQTSTFTLKQGTTPISGFVSYSGVTAIFAPASNLAPSTVYTATITTEAKDLAGNALANDYVWSFTTGAAVVIIPPTVTSTVPVDAATGVPLNQKITATFSKTMDASTIQTSTFTLMQGTTLVVGFVSYSGTTATYTPLSDLRQNTTYTATVTTGAKDLAGNALANNYVWSFTTIAPYTVTLLSEPSAGGTTSGDGTYDPGSSVTVNATANSGYTFTNWIENGSPVSSDASYTFTISSSRMLVANFAEVVLPPPSIDLGLAATYGLAAYSAITNVPTSFSIINGDASIQINPLSSMTGFTFSTPAGAGVVTGSVHAGDAVATQVYTALLAAYNFTKTRTPDVGLFVVGTVDLGTVDIPVFPGHLPGHLPPGVYSSGTTMNINTNVVLDAGGDPNAVWIFQIGSSLTTTSGSVTLEHGAQQKNVFFVPTASATIGTNTTFYGNILAGASITLAGNNTVFGRLLGGALGAGQIDMNGLGSTVTVP
jgi:hypothetical protein